MAVLNQMNAIKPHQSEVRSLRLEECMSCAQTEYVFNCIWCVMGQFKGSHVGKYLFLPITLIKSKNCIYLILNKYAKTL